MNELMEKIELDQTIENPQQQLEEISITETLELNNNIN